MQSHPRQSDGLQTGDQHDERHMGGRIAPPKPNQSLDACADAAQGLRAGANGRIHGIRRFLVPVLEDAIDRSMAMA